MGYQEELAGSSGIIKSIMYDGDIIFFAAGVKKLYFVIVGIRSLICYQSFGLYYIPIKKLVC